jgi:putative ABC transport system permease protein
MQELNHGGKGIISYNAKKIGDQDVLFVDNSFLTMFSYPFAAGNPQTALQEPRTAVLSEALAKKLFQINGNDFGSLLGRPVILGNDSIPYKLTGICKMFPKILICNLTSCFPITRSTVLRLESS